MLELNDDLSFINDTLKQINDKGNIPLTHDPKIYHCGYFSILQKYFPFVKFAFWYIEVYS